IDWHSHHTAPELIDKLAAWGGRPPRPDDYDSPDFARRVGELDEAAIDVQLVCQGAGLDADRLPPELAVQMMRSSNNVMAERIGRRGDRLFGAIATSLQNPDESAREIERMADAGFRAVLLYARGNLITRPEAEPIFAALDAAGLPIFLHGGGGNPVR